VDASTPRRTGRLTDDPAVAWSLRELCHDLIGPAATIKVLAAAAAAEAEAGALQAVQGRLELILTEATQISDMCAHVLGRPGRPGPARLDRIAVAEAESARVRCRTRIEVDAAAVSAWAHPVVLTRIIGNLLANACQAAGPHGQVRVFVAEENGRARLTVEDSGPGFTGRRGRWTSLGMDIVWSLVLDSGGTIQVTSGGLGGLLVSVLFPAGREADGKPMAPRQGDDRADGPDGRGHGDAAWPHDPVAAAASDARHGEMGAVA